MAGVSRLLGIFAAKPSSSINLAKTKTTTVPKPKPNPQPKRKPKPKPIVLSPDAFETPEGIRNVVDNFKKSCESKQFRRWGAMYNSTVLRLARAQAQPMIEEIIEAQKQYKEITSEGFVVRLMTLYGKAQMFDHALKLFDEMPNFNCHRTAMSFSAILNACVTAKRYDVVEDVFRQVPSKYYVQPDLVSYNVVVHAFCEMGSLDSALGMVDEMEEVGLEPDAITFNTLLGGFYEKHGFEEGEKIWVVMKNKGVDPDLVSYRLRLGGMVGDGRIMEAVEFVDEMKLNGVQLDVHCFNVLIKGFCSDGKVEEAKYWYDELVRCGCTADRATYRALVPFLCEKGDLDLAFQLCKGAIGGRLLIDVETLKWVVEGLVSNGRIEEARELVDLARKKKLEVGLPLNGM